jgi:hypothetical protein
LKSAKGLSAVHFTCFGDFGLLLIQAGAAIGLRADSACGGWTLLKHAIDYQSPSCAAALLDHGGGAVDIDDASGIDGETVLHWAISCPLDPDLLRLLLQTGADPTIKDWTQRMPLDHALDSNWASKKGRSKCVALLEAALAVPSSRPALSWTLRPPPSRPVRVRRARACRWQHSRRRRWRRCRRA